MSVSKNRGTPKWMVKIQENPIKMDDLGGKPTILGTSPYVFNLNLSSSFVGCAGGLRLPFLRCLVREFSGPASLVGCQACGPERVDGMWEDPVESAIDLALQTAKPYKIPPKLTETVRMVSWMRFVSVILNPKASSEKVIGFLVGKGDVNNQTSPQLRHVTKEQLIHSHSIHGTGTYIYLHENHKNQPFM